MNIYLAPMEGVTGYIYRRAHADLFGPLDKYMAPFLSPTQEKRFTHRELAEVLPEHNEGLPVVPQILTNRVELFLWAAGELARMGYREVNLNLGCPSGTVVAKGKGAGFLARRPELERFLDEIFARCPAAVSIKTRIGKETVDEWEALWELFRRYPIAELTVHPRLQREQYGGSPHWEAVERLADSPWPVCCNGDVNAPADYAMLAGRFPWAGAVMVGRGAVVDPSLPRQLKGGAPAARAELRRFHDRLYGDYMEVMPGTVAVLHKMKEVWSYLGRRFPGGERPLKALRKARAAGDYLAAVDALFQEAE